MTALELDHNNFTGTIPSELGALTALQGLHLDHNALTGRLRLDGALAVGHRGGALTQDVTEESAFQFQQPVMKLTDSTGDNTGLLVTAGGNVGVGTDSPAQRLHVAGGDARFDGSVHGVVVHATKATSGSSQSGKLTTTDGSCTS